MFVDVRSDENGAGKGKLLFKWNSKSGEISIVQRDTIYRILLMPDGYKIISASKK